MLRELFAHSFIYEKNGQILQGAEGTLEDVAIKVSDIEKVLGLSFDLDMKDFRVSFRKIYVDYLRQVMPELGLIQTSPDGDMHGRLLFKKSIGVENAKRYHRFLKDFLFADGSSSFTMLYEKQIRQQNNVSERSCNKAFNFGCLHLLSGWTRQISSCKTGRGTSYLVGFSC